jgi:hypothetical protein
MKTLREQLWPIVKEYTRQVCEIMQCREWHWVGTNDNGEVPAVVLDLDGYYFLSFEDVQVIVDRIDEWVKRYGSTEAVAEEVQAWQEWWLGEPDGGASGTTAEAVMELWESRRDRYLRTRPRINLEHWLMGCPREPREQSPHDRLRELMVKRELLRELGHTYRQSRSLWNIFDSISADIKICEAKVKELDKKVMETMRKSESYKEFVKSADEAHNGF